MAGAGPDRGRGSAGAAGAGAAGATRGRGPGTSSASRRGRGARRPAGSSGAPTCEHRRMRGTRASAHESGRSGSPGPGTPRGRKSGAGQRGWRQGPADRGPVAGLPRRPGGNPAHPWRAPGPGAPVRLRPPGRPGPGPAEDPGTLRGPRPSAQPRVDTESWARRPWRRSPIDPRAGPRTPAPPTVPAGADRTPSPGAGTRLAGPGKGPRSVRAVRNFLTSTGNWLTLLLRKTAGGDWCGRFLSIRPALVSTIRSESSFRTANLTGFVSHALSWPRAIPTLGALPSLVPAPPRPSPPAPGLPCLFPVTPRGGVSTGPDP